MSPRELIVSYLNQEAPDFVEGVSLLQSYSNKTATCALLLENRDAVKLNKLLRQVLLDMPAAQVPSKPVEVSAIAQEVKSAVKMPAAKGSLEEALLKKFSDSLREINSLKTRLFYIGRDAEGNELPLSKLQEEERFTLSRKIFAINNESLELLKDLKHYQLTGQIRERENFTVEAPLKKVNPSDYKGKENCRKAVAKLKGKIAEAEKLITSTSNKKQLEKLSRKISEWKVKLFNKENELKQYGI